MHIPIFKMPSIRYVSHHAQQGDYSFSADLLFSIIIIFMGFGKINLIGGFYHLDWPQHLEFSFHLLNLYYIVPLLM